MNAHPLARTLVLLIAPVLCGCAATGERPPVPAPAGPGVDLSWLEGGWSGPMWGGEFTAQYAGYGGVVVGHSRHLRGGAESFYEFEVFESIGDQTSYTPYPGGRRGEAFGLTSFDAAGRRAVFEQPEKDYPTRIVFERPTEDRLVITLDDPHGGGEKREVFDLRRR